MGTEAQNCSKRGQKTLVKSVIRSATKLPPLLLFLLLFCVTINSKGRSAIRSENNGPAQASSKTGTLYLARLRNYNWQICISWAKSGLVGGMQGRCLRDSSKARELGSLQPYCVCGVATVAQQQQLQISDLSWKQKAKREMRGNPPLEGRTFAHRSARTTEIAQRVVGTC